MVSKSVGSFLGGLTNNPGFVFIALGLGALLLFRGDIRGAFGSLGESLSNISLPSINLPSLELPSLSLSDISLPSIDLPDLSLPSIGETLSGQGDPILDPIVDPIRQDVEFGDEILSIVPETAGRGRVSARRAAAEAFGEPESVTFTGEGSLLAAAQSMIQRVIAPQVVQSEIEGQQFQGFGESFIGGVVREIPISGLSLSDIIDRFGVTASQASNIRAEAQEDFDNFDFGSNRGFGIGSVFTRPDINTELLSGNVSDPQFTGLTPAEIAERLTGGNIVNF